MTDKTTLKITYREALKQGMHEALINNNKVFLMGEDVGRYGGAFAVSKGFLEEFGEDRIMDVPLSESGFVGAGIGSALAGMRPIVEVMTVNFSLLALDQIINNAATLLHMSGGQINVPVVIRMNSGIGNQLAAQHSHSWEPFYAHIPGLKIVSAGTHEDARGMLLTALESPDPVVIFEYTSLLNMESEIPSGSGAVDIDKAKVRREGKDLSIITYGPGVYKALAAAEILASSGIDVEIIDLRVLNPIDNETIINSVAKTLERLCGIEVPIPYPKHLEDASIPQKQDIVDSALKMIQND
ncbi:transketolase C-terminal domain-containing protein [uncultured Eudoraea sp.]|uniref:alpha-ketoacid dehydrogenase subunit beta n=1 Tax=uncultured Eudoraea sp. TaxID=1035614 RepID=UPI00262BBE98|nr:transketolase C-terminal domain-containing protein [uncultured Eudoraea sp.]